MRRHFEVVEILYDNYDDRSIPWVVMSFKTLAAAKNYVRSVNGYRFDIECFRDDESNFHYATYRMLTDKTFWKESFK